MYQNVCSLYGHIQYLFQTISTVINCFPSSEQAKAYPKSSAKQQIC